MRSRGVQRQPGERGRPEAVGRAEGGDADDVHAQRLRRQQRGRRAERQVPGPRRAAVDDHLVVGPRGVALDEPVRVQGGVADPVGRPGRRAVAADHLAVTAHQLPVALQVGLGVGHPGHVLHPLEQANADAGPRAGVKGIPDLGRAAQNDVGAPVGLAEELVEVGRQDVAQQQGPGQEGHAAADREQGGDEPPLARPQAAGGDGDHLSSPRCSAQERVLTRAPPDSCQPTPMLHGRPRCPRAGQPTTGRTLLRGPRPADVRAV